MTEYNYNNDKWCAIHNCEEEPVAGGIKCGECWHLFPIEQDLIDEYVKMLEETGQIKVQINSVDQVLFCPLCLHDF